MNMGDSPVFFKDTNSSQVRQYGTRFELFKVPPTGGLADRHFNGTARRHVNMGGDESMMQAGFYIAHGLFQLDGIKYVQMRPFEVNIHRATAFNWDELHDGIIEVIKAADPRCNQETVPAQDRRPVRRIRWFDTRSDQVRHYGVTTRLYTPRHNLDAEFNLPLMGGLPQPLLTEAGKRLVESIMSIPGVKHINARAFEINVHRYDHFRFSEMHETIVAMLRSLFEGSDAVAVENRYEFS